MGNIFADPKTTKQLAREQKRHLERSLIALQDEEGAMQRREKTLILEVKKAAAANQMARCKIMVLSTTPRDWTDIGVGMMMLFVVIG
jgi:hypothetical protein